MVLLVVGVGNVARRVRDDAIASGKGASGGWARTSFGGFWGELGGGFWVV